MNITVLIFSIFYIIYGIFGLFGIQNISEKFKNRPWTRQYIRICGVSDLLLGVPWAAAWLLLRNTSLSTSRQIVLYVALALPSLALTVAADVKYRRLLKQASAA